MKNKYFLSICFLLIGIIAVAQKDSSSKKISFHSYNSVGILEGSGGSSFQIQSINGVLKNKWFAGVGVGIDYYFDRTVPVFIDVRRTLFNKSETPYIFIDGGYNFSWTRKDEEELFAVSNSGGLFYEIGIGYQVPVFKSQHLFFSAGYSGKNLTKTINTMPWSSRWPPPSESIREYEYSLKRISIKAGLRF